MTSKQRAALRSLASNEQPVTIIGKEGITEGVFVTAEQALNKRELIKISLLKTSGIKAKDAINIICERLKAQPVAAMGNTLVIYKYSEDQKAKHIEF